MDNSINNTVEKVIGCFKQKHACKECGATNPQCGAVRTIRSTVITIDNTAMESSMHAGQCALPQSARQITSRSPEVFHNNMHNHMVMLSSWGNSVSVSVSVSVGVSVLMNVACY